VKFLPRAVLEIPSSDFHILMFFGSEWTPWANCLVSVLDLQKWGCYGPPKLGQVTFGENPLRGARAPIWPVHVIAQGTREKQFLFHGNRPPFGGDMGVWKLAFLALWRRFSRTHVIRISPNFYRWQTTTTALTQQKKTRKSFCRKSAKNPKSLKI